MINRRDFIKLAGMGVLGLTIPNYALSLNFNISYKPIKWEPVADGLDFSRTEVYRNKSLVDVIATLKINPKKNKIRVFSGYHGQWAETYNIEDWQKKTNALAMINSNQYREEYSPCALVICDGEQKGPKEHQYSKLYSFGMLVAEPEESLEGKLKRADLLDFDYDKFDYKTTPYTQGVQHWPILLDRKDRIRVNKTNQQANRTVVAKTNEDEILFMTTEGGYFTLYNFGRFLKESNSRTDKGFNVHTAMNMDGGSSSEMIVKSPHLEYSNNVQTKNPRSNRYF